jgi:hypothetical protein
LTGYLDRKHHPSWLFFLTSGCPNCNRDGPDTPGLCKGEGGQRRGLRATICFHSRFLVASTCCVDCQVCGWEASDPVWWNSRSMSSRAFLNSFMLCPTLRAKSGNFFAPKRTRTMRRIINRSGPPRFPIPDASIFISNLNWSGLLFIPYHRE